MLCAPLWVGAGHNLQKHKEHKITLTDTWDKNTTEYMEINVKEWFKKKIEAMAFI